MLDVNTVAGRLNVSPSMVYQLIAQGRLSAIRLGIRALRIPEKALDEYVRSCAANGC